MPEPAYRNPWLDPNVREALDEGRSASDISLICCGRCGNYGYYNDGSHFTCGVCDWTAAGERLDAIFDEGGIITLDELETGETGP